MNKPDTVAPPEGYRLLRDGEAIRKTDIYLLGSWKPTMIQGGHWNEKSYWPMARKKAGGR
jgi:hypothetical protein